MRNVITPTLLVSFLLLAGVGRGADLPLYAMDTCTKQNYPQSDVLSPEAQIDLLKRLGYAGIAWTAEDPAAVATVAKAASDRGVPMWAIYLGADLTTRGLEADPRLAAIAESLKGRDTLLWLHVGSSAFAPSSPAGDAAAVPGLRLIADLAAARGLRVALYPHTGEWVERVQDAVRLAKLVNRPNFGVTFNLCHALMVGDEAKIPALLKEAAPHLFAVTLNGADSGAARTDWQRLIRPLGEGSFDTASFLRELDHIRFRGPIGLQGYGLSTPPQDHLAASMQAWRTRVAGGWLPLPFDAGLAAWREPRGKWFVSGDAKLKPDDDKLLAGGPGTGVLINAEDGRTTNLLSSAEMGDCELHVEFMMARQSNSGVYLMARYEVQVLDSWGVARPGYDDCGGIYTTGDDSFAGSPPRVNASLPPGQWQTYDIVFRAPRFNPAANKLSNARFERVLHNGKVVQENVEVPKPTVSASWNDEKPLGSLMLQGDHGPVAYRNLRCRSTPPASP